MENRIIASEVVVNEDPEGCEAESSSLPYPFSSRNHSSSSESDLSLAGYTGRVADYRQHFLQHAGEQHAAVFRACKTGELHTKFVDDKLHTIENREGDSDFAMQPMIRLLYQDYSQFSAEQQERWIFLQSRMVAALDKFPFWPTPGVRNMDNIVFWSENHLFMTLSAAYLFYQFTAMKQPQSDGSNNQDWERAHPECLYLRQYIDMHLHPLFNGVFEVNSHVYLPFTLIALMNLYDFVQDKVLQTKVGRLLQRIVYLILLSTDPLLGVGNLVASARAFLRTRLRNHGHNINILLFLLTGNNTPNNHHKYEAAAFLSHLLLTTWVPDFAELGNAYHYTGYSRVNVSPTIADLSVICRESMGVDIDTNDQYIPFLWSAGLVTHPLFVARSQAYIQRHCLQHNVHLWPLSMLLSPSMAESYRHFAAGQAYTNVRLNLYKQPHLGLLLTSFELFSERKASYQQLPWMCNFVGVPIWSQSGAGSESMAGFALTNTHNPLIQQQEDVLVLSYLAPRMLTSTLIVGSVFSYKVRMFWPANVFVDQVTLVYYGKSFADSQMMLDTHFAQMFNHENNRSTRHKNNNSSDLKLAKTINRTLRWMAGGKKKNKKGNKIISKAIQPVVTQATGVLLDHLSVGEGYQAQIQEIVSANLYQKSDNHSNYNDEGEDEDDDENKALERERSRWEDSLYRANKTNWLWKIAQRHNAYVALLCTKNVTIIERHTAKDALLHPFREPLTRFPTYKNTLTSATNTSLSDTSTENVEDKNGKADAKENKEEEEEEEEETAGKRDEDAVSKAPAVRMICESPRHSWVLVTGSALEFRSIAEFVDRRLSLVQIQEQDDRHSSGHYHLVVTDLFYEPPHVFHVHLTS